MLVGQLFDYALYGQKEQSIHSHRELLEEVKHVTHGSLQPSQQNPRNKDGIIQEKPVEECMPVTCTGDPQGSENFMAVETLPAWIERDREKAKCKKAFGLPTLYRQEAG